MPPGSNGAPQAGGIASHSPHAQYKKSNTQRRQRQADEAWSPAYQPGWLTEKLFAEQIRPKLAGVSTSLITSRLKVSAGYAGQIRKGYRPRTHDTGRPWRH